MNWNSGFIEDINRRRIQERGLAPDMARRHDHLLRLTSRNLYGEKVHYALELIQNAEDADAPSITFIFEKDKLIVVNDGNVFTPDEVEAICSVEPGRKKNKIGFFGVGFKSVFNITSTPQVISSAFNFQIENYVCPKPLNHLSDELKKYYSKDKGSIFVFPQTEGLPAIPELIENFKEIDDKILLFLNKLKSLHFIDKVNGEKWSIEKSPTGNSLILLKNGRTNQITKWMVFHKDLPISEKDVLIPEGKEGITDTRIIVAFPCDEVTKETYKASTVYCYLPTNKRSDMPFLVQADFVPTVGRASIQDVDWNRWLLRKLGELAAEAVEQIKDDPSLGKELYSFIPLRDEVQEPLMDILSNAMYRALISKKIARTLSLEWKKPDECAVAVNPEITNIISQDDLKHLFQKRLSYVNIELSKRTQQILTDLGSSILGETEVIEFLAKEELIKNRKPQWFLNVYGYLREIFDVRNRYYDSSFRWDEDKLRLFSKLEKTKFILTNQGSLIPLKDHERPDRLICYPQSIDLSEVKELFTEGELVFLNKHFQLSTITRRKEPDPDEEERRKRAREFFEGVGVRIYFKQSHVIKDVILPKYSSGKYQEYDDLKLYKLMNYIRLYWPTLESEVKNKKLSEKVFDEIRQTVRLKAYTRRNGEKTEEYISPGKLCFPKRYGKTEVMENLFAGVVGIYFLHPYYLNREKYERKKKRSGRLKAEYSWKKFAEMLGVWSSPRVEKNSSWVSISGKDEYSWVKKQYSPSGLHEISGDSFSSDVEKVIEYCSQLKDTETMRLRMLMLLQSFSDNWKTYNDYCRSTYKYKFHSEMQVTLHSSSFLNYLKNCRWIPAKDGGFYRPEEVFLDTRKNRLILGDSVKFADLAGNRAFLEDIGLNLEPSLERVIKHLKDCKANEVVAGKRELEKFKEIYAFIAEKVDEKEPEKQETIEKIKKEFDQNELIYIPRKDRSWWKPRLVFWRDYSRTFGPLRGYVEHEGKEIYPSAIRGFFFPIGIKQRPSVEEALQVLDELRKEKDIDTLKRIAGKVYSYIGELISHTQSALVEWQKYSFLTKNGKFSHPKGVYYEDDEEYSREFQDKAEFIYLPFSSWIKLSPFLRAAGFKSFAKNLSIKKSLGTISEIEGGEMGSVIKCLSHVKAYLLNMNPELCERLESEGLFDKLPNIEIYETTEIKLDLFLKNNEAENIFVKGIEREVYYSKEENRLYILKGLSLLSGKVAKEVSRVFRGAENEVFPFLSSILPKANDEETLDNMLQLFGIDEQAIYTSPEKVELLPDEEGPDTEGETKEKTKQTLEEKKTEKPTVEPPRPPSQPKDLIDPDEFYPSIAREYFPYKKTEGETPKVIKEIKLVEGKPGISKPTKEPTLRTGTKDAEEIALRIVLNYERGEEREAEDRHRQKGIGYDVYSKKADGAELFIEVKHFSEQEGTFKLLPHQLEKAKKEGDKYYVYIVTGLKEGIHPKKLFIIQNPAKWLTPEPPVEEEYSDWKNAVMKEFELGKA